MLMNTDQTRNFLFPAFIELLLISGTDTEAAIKCNWVR